jgi:translation initiation factor 1 (eIF-1/SUI1)
MKNLIAALALVVFATASFAGDAPQAPAKPVAKAESKACECKTVEVARKASLRERRNLVVVEKVPVVEVKKVEVKKEVKADCCTSCTTAAPARRLLGGLRNRTAAVVECASCK